VRMRARVAPGLVPVAQSGALVEGELGNSRCSCCVLSCLPKWG